MMTVSVQIKNNEYYAVLNWYICGKRKQKWVDTGYSAEKGKNSRKAARRADEILDEWKLKMCVNYTDMPFHKYLLSWLNDKEGKIDDTTHAEYTSTIKKVIYPYFEEHPVMLQNLTATDIEEFYHWRQAEYGVSPNTISHYQAIIYGALKRAVKKKILASNPAASVELPKVTKFHGDFYTEEETNQLLEAAVGTKLQTPIVLAVVFGLRRGEICGLRWDAINLTKKYLTIKGKVTDKGLDGMKLQYRKCAKTDAGYRSLPLTDEMVTYFAQIKAIQAYNKKTAGPEYNREWDGFVCVNDTGDLITPGYISYTFPHFLKKNKLRKVRFHDLRHTNATLLLSKGTLLQDLQPWLGHEKQSTTADYYGHFVDSIKCEMANTITSVVNVPK